MEKEIPAINNKIKMKRMIGNFDIRNSFLSLLKQGCGDSLSFISGLKISTSYRISPDGARSAPGFIIAIFVFGIFAISSTNKANAQRSVSIPVYLVKGLPNDETTLSTQYYQGDVLVNDVQFTSRGIVMRSKASVIRGRIKYYRPFTKVKEVSASFNESAQWRGLDNSWYVPDEGLPAMFYYEQVLYSPSYFPPHRNAFNSCMIKRTEVTRSRLRRAGFHINAKIGESYVLPGFGKLKTVYSEPWWD